MYPWDTYSKKEIKMCKVLGIRKKELFVENEKFILATKFCLCGG